MDSTAQVSALPIDRLRRTCKLAPEDLDPTGTTLLDNIAQQRATDAIRFGIEMDRAGYNVFVLGPTGSHRHALVERLATECAREKGAPDDWCYINNFKDPERPAALRLPPGKGAEFRDAMRALIDEIRVSIPATFEGDEYRSQLKALEQETQSEVEGQWQSLNDLAAREDIGVIQTPTGYVLAPLVEGKVIDDKEFEKLPEEKRKSIQETIERLSEELQARIEQMPRLRKQHREKVRALNREVAAHAVGVLLEQLKKDYADLPAVLRYLDDVEKDIIRNADEFRQTEAPTLPFMSGDSTALLASYEVNLVVSNEDAETAPVVYEPNPNYPNLLGKIEHRSEMGALVTDFRMIRSGVLLQANGGYLVLDIHRVLGRPLVWEALKQALFTRKVRIESVADTLGYTSTTTLQPEPIPLDVKILLIGERWLYYLLSAHDSEFRELFKVAADLDDDLERTDDNTRAYVRLIGNRIAQRELMPFSCEATAIVVEQRARRADDSERLSMHMRSLDDLLMQADYWARQRDVKEVAAGDVRRALAEQERRLNRVQTQIVDAIRRDTLLIDTSGSRVGQVNGLSVTGLGEYRFGHPVRITATTRVGTGQLVDIEREVKLGGAIHSKGVLILSSALAARYAREIPLSLHGSIVFEQSYGGVDGDSASVAELCVLLSSISNVPIRQDLAVTGSINQLGRVQAVGGINEKIEGFFEICRLRGLDGTHGVVIPEDNVKHLMLNDDVLDAVRDGKFAVYAVEDIDQALTVLTGEPAGTRDDEGRFADGTVNRKVEDQLIRYATLRRQFAETPDDKKDPE